MIKFKIYTFFNKIADELIKIMKKDKSKYIME